MSEQRHHHHATVSEVIVFHGDGDPDYLFRDWAQQEEDPCDCDIVDPWVSDGGSET